MAEEKISIEAESDLIWLEIDGFVNSYSLRMLLWQNRNAEGNWAAIALPELQQQAQIFCQTREILL